MASLSFEKGQSFQSDNRTIYKIVSGSVTVSYSTGSTKAEKGEMLGSLELFLDEPTFEYEADEDLVLQTLPMKDLSALHSQISSNPGIGKALFNLALKQYNELSKDYEMFFYEIESLYNTLTDDFSQFQSVCSTIGTSVMEPEQMIGLTAPIRPGKIAVSAFYDQFLSDPNCNLAKELANPWTASAFIYHIGKDAAEVVKAFERLEEYHARIISCYLNDSGTGLINIALNTLGKFRSSTPDIESLLSTIRFSIASLGSDSCIDEDLLNECSASLDELVSTFSNSTASSSEEEIEESGPISNAEAEAGIANSLQTILSYAQIANEDCEAIFASMRAFEKLPDRAGTDDVSRKHCRTLIGAFNKAYQLCAKKAVQNPDAVPVVIKMFLYFGYMDEGVAGHESAIELYKLAASHKIDPNSNVYLFFDWLQAIYNGKKEPSRNEFEQDYADSIHAMKVSNQITATEEKTLLDDQVKKVEYELANVFPSVNKITYGRISTFCPVFSSHNLPGSLEKSMVTYDKVSEILQFIQNVDFSAFAREIMYTYPKVGINKEFLHSDILPDFILLPNVGIRGAMWQEIESKKRSTPSRMMLPTFLMGDLKPAILRMTGEYRWEMCKRIQGARWNDLSDPSLTSEYCDYIQFYRKNVELSSEAKEKIKNNLVRAKNNYKEIFLYDYSAWIMFESTGSPRLNKVSRAILAKYCPFPKAIRANLSSNPQFGQLFERTARDLGQAKHRLDGIKAKFNNAGIPFPDELLAEYDYLDR